VHPRYGTLEVRVADQQARAGDSAAMAAVTHALVAWLADRYDAGDPAPVHPTWRIEQNRWAAARHGMDAVFADLDSGRRRPAAVEVDDLLERIAPQARRLGGEGHLDRAACLARRNGARELRDLAGGAAAACHRLAGAFLDD
jgi:carboxylate-amine ligase